MSAYSVNTWLPKNLPTINIQKCSIKCHKYSLKCIAELLSLPSLRSLQKREREMEINYGPETRTFQYLFFKMCFIFIMEKNILCSFDLIIFYCSMPFFLSPVQNLSSFTLCVITCPCRRCATLKYLNVQLLLLFCSSFRFIYTA